MERPYTTVVLAMTADGKISNASRSPALFGSPQDQRHLEIQVAQADALLVGAGTIRAYQRNVMVRDPGLLAARAARGQSPQPVQIVSSPSGHLDRHWEFFRQPIPRWLLTSPEGARPWQGDRSWDRLIAHPQPFPWEEWFQSWRQEMGWQNMVLLGGGTLIADLLAGDLVDELWLTLCPFLLGGSQAATPVDGLGRISPLPLSLEEQRRIGDELFLRYKVRREGGDPESDRGKR